jgi:hypothetical protein
LNQNQIKSNQIKSNQIKSNQIKSNQIKSNQIKSNMPSPSKIYRNQFETADDIIYAFRENKWCVLLAMMQSGKTGIFELVGAEMLRRGLIERIVVFSGNREIELREQTKDIVKFSRGYGRYLRDIQHLEDEDVCEVLVDEWAEKREVVWGAEMKHYVQDPTKKTLYIHDESHYGASEKMEVNKFEKKCGISATGQDLPENVWVLSVSATPIAELIDNEAHLQGKRVVIAKPGDRYHGIANMFEHGQFKHYTNPKQELNSLLKKMTNGYALVRIGATRKDAKVTHADVVNAAARNAGKAVEIIEYYEGGKDYVGADGKKVSDVDKILKVEPSVPTLILLKGKVRMGKRITKTHIKWVFEFGTGQKTDTLVQGLIGRLCGYDTRPDIDIWIHQTHQKRGEIQKFVDMYANDERVMQGETPIFPSRAMNVHGTVKSTSCWQIAIPEKINLDCNPKCVTKHNIWKVLQELEDNSSTKNSASICEQLHERLYAWATEGKTPSHPVKFCRNNLDVGIAKQKNLQQTLENANQLGTPPMIPGSSLGISEGGEEIRMWFNPKKNADGTYTTWFVFRTDKIPAPAVALPLTTGKEIYCIQNEDGDNIEANGGFVSYLKPETMTTESAMLDSLCECIQKTEEPTTLITQRYVTSQIGGNGGWKGITVTTDLFKSLRPGGTIFNEIKERHPGITITIKKASGRVPKGDFWKTHVRLTKISW